MSKEIEKKYRLTELPAGKLTGKKIRQGYLDKTEHEVAQLVTDKFGEDEIDLDTIKEVRIRQKGEGENAKFYLTLKSDGTLQRDEYETSLTAVEFEELWPMATEGVIEKTRYEMALGDILTAEIDRYEGNLEGLFTLEIEYDPEITDEIDIEEAIHEVTDEARDVTEFKTFKNRELARTSSLEDLEARFAKEADEKMMRDLNANPSHLNQA